MRTSFRISAFLLAAAISISVSAQSQEWPNYRRYASDNDAVKAAQAKGTKRPVAVLMGDSITDGWPYADPQFFKDNNLVGRGISGQCTAHMLARFQRDVVELHPKYVAILAGINDIGLNPGFSDLENIYKNIISMCQIAKQNKIKVILCSTPPSDHIGWRPEVTNTSEQVKWLNDNLKAYAKANRIKFCDYAEVLADENGATRKDYSHDSVHPNLDGYKAMEGVLLKAIR